jgi:hypothetical protein
MSMFEESGDFDGALREKASAPRIPPRRRRGQSSTEEASEVQEESSAPTPAVKKNSGWSDEAPATSSVTSGRRAVTSTEGDTPTAAIEVSSAPTAEKFEDLLEIPDLDEQDQSEQASVAEPGYVETVALPTDLSLDEGALPPSQVD